MAFLSRIAVVVVCCLFSADLWAAQITGTVTNGTTNKPAGSAEVVLLALQGGMDEVAHARTDSQGRFTVDVPDPGGPHLLRVNHQDVNYFQAVPPGSTSGNITIYDSAKQVKGISEDARVYRMQTGQGQLEVSVTYTLRNESQPPRTKMDTETFEAELPPGAQMVEATARAGANGMPVATSPVPTGKNNRYAMSFPIRPGQTQFLVMYKMPYSGSYQFNFAPDSTLSELGVLVPKSMQFSGISRTFDRDSDEAGLAVFFIKNALAHQNVSFAVSGEGVAPPEGQSQEAAPPVSSQPAPAGTSGGGSTALWVVAAVMAVAVVGGAFWLWRRSTVPQPTRDAVPVPAKARSNPGTKTPAPQASGESFLDSLKEELFQLERDRLDGKVTAEEYQKSKAGLDALLRRQLKKGKS